MKGKRYYVCPGFVISQHDGDRHYVSVSDLMALYGVRDEECLIEDHKAHISRYELERLGMIVLRPRDDGNYSLNACVNGLERAKQLQRRKKLTC